MSASQQQRDAMDRYARHVKALAKALVDALVLGEGIVEVELLAPAQCNCPIQDLLAHGCQCGGS